MRPMPRPARHPSARRSGEGRVPTLDRLVVIPGRRFSGPASWSSRPGMTEPSVATAAACRARRRRVRS
jgi:hypothetical protein